MSTQTNGRIRKNLADQIDRLDTVIDALGDGLNEVVASAIKIAVGDAVKQAIQSIVTELVSNPDVLTKLRDAAGPNTPTTSNTPTPINQPSTKPTKAKLTTRLCAWVGEKMGAARRRCEDAYRQGVLTVGTWVSSTVDTVQSAWKMTWPFRSQVLVAMSVGVAVGVGAYFAGPYAAAAAGWVGGFVTTLAVQVGIAVKRILNGDQSIGQ